MGWVDGQATLAMAQQVLLEAGEPVLGYTHGAAIRVDGSVGEGAFAWGSAQLVFMYYGSAPGDYITIQMYDLDRMHKPPLAPNATVSTRSDSFARGFNQIAELVAPKDRMKALAAAMRGEVVVAATASPGGNPVVGSVVNGQVFTDVGWRPLRAATQAPPWYEGDVVNSHVWTGSSWVLLR